MLRSRIVYYWISLWNAMTVVTPTPKVMTNHRSTQRSCLRSKYNVVRVSKPFILSRIPTLSFRKNLIFACTKNNNASFLFRCQYLWCRRQRRSALFQFVCEDRCRRWSTCPLSILTQSLRTSPTKPSFESMRLRSKWVNVTICFL